MDYIRREVEDRKLVEEAIDPDGFEGFGHGPFSAPANGY
jgi:hypothetical protein